MLSGFVIACGYKEKIRGGLSVEHFMKKRVAHIYIPFAISTCAAGMVEAIYYKSFHEFYLYGIDVYHFLLNLLCMQTGWMDGGASFNVPAWCISVEILCYILFYLTVWFCSEKNIRVSYFYCAFLLLGWTAIANQWNVPFLYSYSTARGYLCFFGGCLLSEASCKMSESTARNTGRMAAVILLAAVFLSRLVHLPQWCKDIGLCFSLIICPCIIWSAITVPAVSRFCSCRIFRTLGKISLSIYLCHWPIQVLIVYLNRRGAVQVDYASVHFLSVYMATTLLISGVFYLLVEKKQKKIWERRL